MTTQEDDVLYSSQYAATPPSGLRVATRRRASDGASIQSVYTEGGTVSPADDLTMSEFGERRVAAPGNRADVEFLYSKQPLIVDDISSGTGAATHRANSRDVLLTVGGAAAGATGGLRYHTWVPYTPGNGQEIDVTGTFDAAGLGGSMSVFLRSTVSGATTLQEIPQAQWTAAVGDVDWRYSQICRISFQSLRVGRVQFALVRAGLPTKVAEITNDNLRATGYWQYAGLPPYWKVFNDTAGTVVEFGYGDDANGVGFRFALNGTQAGAQAVAICCTVKSQGGAELYDMHGYPFSTPIQAAKTVSTTLIPVLSIRMAATFGGLTNRTLSIPTFYSVLTDNPLDYVLLYRPTLTGPSWTAVDATYSAMEYDNTASAVSGGIRIDTQSLSAGNNQSAQADGLLGRTIMSLGSGTADILTIAAIRAGSSDSKVKAALKWKEIR